MPDAINFGVWVRFFDAFYEFMPNARIGHDFGKISEILLCYQAAGHCQIVKPGGLHGSGTVGDIVQRIPFPYRPTAVIAADPQAAVVFRIVQAVFFGLQNFGQIFKTDLL